ncbi:MAG: S41 family peptidase [Bacteroidetes bacterium]|nr:S41 family peptidase [Bacteroidota bacterium]MBS1973177.1 S41 family peptidase [Bacteroidota bacterium]
MKGLKVWLPLLFAMVMVFGMAIGYRLSSDISPKGFFKVQKRAPVDEVMNLIGRRYVDSVNIDTLGENAIQGMLAHLDPHSIYIPPIDVTGINEDLQGNFEGIGVEFQIFYDTVNIVGVVAGGPSDKAGLEVGDKIIKVNDSAVAGNGTNADKIKSLLRGPGASNVTVTVIRNSKPLKVAIVRGTIPLPSVDASYMINKTTGYIHINKFSETTHPEFVQAMQFLQKNPLQELILDLRGNGGGILQQAIAVADDFLDGDKLIVYTQGANSPKVEYRCKVDGLFEKGKLIALVDEGTASASEVLVGALQDWDRATIIGRRTFGKGLVQEQYQLSDGSALRLTVARYYTPSGRSIQKPYNKEDHESYNEEVMMRFHDGEVLHGDTSTAHNGKVYKTHNGKIVYGGGGITPDIFVAFDTATFDHSITSLYVNNTLNRFVYTYYMQHLAEFKQFKTASDFASGFSHDEQLWKSLADYAAKDSVSLKTISEKDKQVLLLRTKALLGRQGWRQEGYFEVANTFDPVVMKALEQ